MSILMWIVNLLIKSFDKKTENVDNENAMHSKTSVIISGFFFYSLGSNRIYFCIFKRSNI